MQEAYLLAVVVILCILLIVFAKYRREGFKGEATTHKGLTEKHEEKYNSIAASLVIKGNEPVLGKNTSGMFGNVVTTMTSSGATNDYVDDPYPLEGGVSGLYADIQMCERVTTTDCGIFDNPEFADSCGLCLDIGKNSMNKPATGGLTLIQKDKKYYRDGHQGNGIPDYVPTAGSCPAKRMVSNKKECIRLKKQIECEKNTTFNSPSGCSLCYSDSSYHIVDPTEQPGLFVGAGTLFIVGSGILIFSEVGVSEKRRTNLAKMTSPLRIELMGPEMTNLTLELKRLPQAVPYDPKRTYEIDDVIFFKRNVYTMVEGANGPGYAPDRPGDKLWELTTKEEEYVGPPPAFIAGVLSGTTGNSGNFTFDLFRLILTDSVSGRKPRTGGSIEIKPGDAEAADATKMIPAHGKKAMKMIARSPFTFLDTTTEEAASCPTSPFVTKQSSAEFLQADPCYRKGMGPGNYSLECLQNIFLTNGCEETGKGYPATPAEASAAMFGPDGTALTVSQISDRMYGYAVASSTGVSAEGKKLDMKSWSDASVFCTGRKITSPCDTEDKETGPLGNECIVYLWDNQGDNKELGTTYSSSLSRSLFGSGNTPRFCNRKGSLSPLDETGKAISENINFWKSQGGVNAVKAIMKRIHSDANNSTIPEMVRAEKIRQCYGVIPGDRPSFTNNFVSDNSSQFNPPPPPPPKPVIACVAGLSYVKLGEFKLAYLNDSPCNAMNNSTYAKGGYIFLGDKGDWTKIANNTRNETWQHVAFTAKDMKGLNVINQVRNAANKFNIPDRITQQNPPFINYYIKHKTQDSSVVLNKCGHINDLGCGAGVAVGMFQGNNWWNNSDKKYREYVVDMITGGPAPVGTPLFGDNDIYELYFALTTDTGCVATGESESKPTALASSLAAPVPKTGAGWNL
jgi:hypothetical protein